MNGSRHDFVVFNHREVGDVVAEDVLDFLASVLGGNVLFLVVKDVYAREHSQNDDRVQRKVYRYSQDIIQKSEYLAVASEFSQRIEDKNYKSAYKFRSDKIADDKEYQRER